MSVRRRRVRSRIAAEQATLAVRQEAERFYGWKLFGLLQERPEGTDDGNDGLDRDRCADVLRDRGDEEEHLGRERPRDVVRHGQPLVGEQRPDRQQDGDEEQEPGVQDRQVPEVVAPGEVRLGRDRRDVGAAVAALDPAGEEHHVDRQHHDGHADEEPERAADPGRPGAGPGHAEIIPVLLAGQVAVAVTIRSTLWSPMLTRTEPPAFGGLHP